jgi:hypothetical protein
MNNMGIAAPEIAIIPEAVDTELFDPSLARINKIHYSDRLLNDYCNLNDNSCTNDLPVFEFLSIFKWEHRKGWNVLLDAYWKAFQVDDAVVLRLRTYVPSWEMGTKNITSIIEDYGRDNYNKELNQLGSNISISLSPCLSLISLYYIYPNLGLLINIYQSLII